MLTRHQRKAMLFIEKELERTGGVAPSVREMPAISATTAHHRRGHCSQVSRLEGTSAGSPGRDRAIEVLRPVTRVAVYRFDDREKALRSR